jgi:hypothetical protein
MIPFSFFLLHASFAPKKQVLSNLLNTVLKTKKAANPRLHLPYCFRAQLHLQEQATVQPRPKLHQSVGRLLTRSLQPFMNSDIKTFRPVLALSNAASTIAML